MTGVFNTLLRFLSFGHRLVFIVSAVLAWVLFRHYFVSDAIGQLALAKHISNGHFSQVVNGYWSPLLSWLLAPLTLLPGDGMDVFRLLNLAFAFISLNLCTRLLNKYIPSLKVAQLAACGIAALLPFWALYYLTADMLFLTLLLWYLLLHAEGRFYQKPLFIALTGILLYFAKAYGLFFFMAHSVLMLFFQPRSQFKTNGTQYIKGLLIFLPVCAIWITLLSNRYGHFTVSEAARYNGAIATTQPLVHPVDTIGLVAPLPGYTYSAWEDITQHIAIQKPAKTLPGWKQLVQNTRQYFLLLNKTPRYGLVLAIILLLVTTVLAKPFLKGLILPVVTLFVFSGGYLLLFVEERYLLFPVIILYLLVVALSARLVMFLRFRWLRWCLYLLPLYILMRPAADIYLLTDTSEEQSAYDISTYFKVIDNRTGIAYASWNAYQAAPLAWHLKWKDCGGLSGYGNDLERMLHDLQQNQIQYIVAPKDILLPEKITRVFQLVYRDEKNVFVVYGLKTWLAGLTR
jgi:hypothetical protein